MWLCVLSSVALPISLFCSTGLCPFRCFLFVSVCPIHPHQRPLVSLVLTAHACPRCPILYSDLPWMCSIKIFFNLQVAIEAVIACDCIVVDETWAGIRPELSPCCHPQVPLVLCLLFFFHPSPLLFFHQSLSLPLIRWVEHALPPVTLILAICPHDRSKNYNACCVWRALRSVTPPLCPGAWSFTGA